MNKLTINTLTDRLNFVFHGASCVATCVAISHYAGSPLITTAALATTVAVALPLSNYANRLLLEAFPSSSPHLFPPRGKLMPQVVEVISRGLQMDAAPSLHLLVPAETETQPQPKQTHQNWFAKTVRKQALRFLGKPNPNFLINDALMRAVVVYIGRKLKKEKSIELDPTETPAGILKDVIQKITGKYANAAAFGDKPYGIFVTEPLFSALPDFNEQTSVLAHEFGHLAAKHNRKSRLLGLVGISAVLIGKFNLLGVLISSIPGMLALGTSLVASFASRYLLRSVGVNVESEEGKTALRNVSSLASTTAVLGTAFAKGRTDILAAWAASALVVTGTKLIMAHYSRCNEFQADRIAAKLIGNPRLLACALQKITAYDVSIKPEIQKYDYTKGPLILRPFKRAQALFWSHPHLKRRCKRMENMAKRMDRASAMAPA